MGTYVFETAVYMLLALPVYLAARAATLFLLRRRAKVRVSWAREAALCLFTLCLIGLASQTLLPQMGFRRERLEAAFSARINLVPFQVFADSAEQIRRNANTGYFLINFLGNLAMFVPVGLFPPMLSRRYSFKRTVLLGLSISLAIELCQIPLWRGADIDDVWLNTLGAAIGYGFYALARRLWPGMATACLKHMPSGGAQEE